ncbi:putative non-specific serine/threonine protein kinase [Medicago truncatula]|nr:receptor-like protein 9b [Medicago truncatula]RHN58497.1 putative non-specific serine/threonine protein kinase [Medicago truncatula]
MTGLDLSSNNLSGSIPAEIGELREIIALNLSHNRLSGSIPESFSNLINIESLDLSNNNLSGKIPQNLNDLYSLAIFNVSYNKLSGKIPTTMQFANFDENNYRGNSDLCGSVLNISCNDTIFSTLETMQNQTAMDMESFYWGFAASYVTLVIGLAIIILWVNSHWCMAWFYYVDMCIFYCFSRCFKNAFH